MRFRFDSDFDPERFGKPSFGGPEFPAQAAGDELRRWVARAKQGDGEAAAAFRGHFEPQVRRVVRRVLSRRTPDRSPLGRRVRDEIERILRSQPSIASWDPQRLEDLVTARLCRAMLSSSRPRRAERQALKETVRY